MEKDKTLDLREAIQSSGELVEVTSLDVNPTSGNTSSTVTIQSLGGKYTGRDNRNTALVAKLDGYDKQVQINVTEEGVRILEKISPSENTLTIDNSKQDVTFEFESNGSYLALTIQKFNSAPLKEEDVTLTIDGEPISLLYYSNATYAEFPQGTIQQWNANLADYGSHKSYKAVFTLSIPENTGEGQSVQCRVDNAMDSNYKPIDIYINRGATDKYIYVNTEGITELDITLPKDGTAKTVELLANADWSIKQQE